MSILNTKHIAKLYILILALGTILSLYIPKNEVTASEEIVIPKEAIRLRILANSDSESDQALKRKVRDEVNKEINGWVAELTSVEDARNLIRSRLPEVKKIAESVLESENSNQTVHTDFGKVEFPTKLYGQFLYPAGEYEAILITLGEGKGANWWCVLFPPLCFLDFSNGIAVQEEEEKKEELKNSKKEKQEEKKESKETTAKEKSNHKAPNKVDNKIVEKEEQPVYTAEDEQPVEVKFFVKELWKKLF